MLKYSVQVTLRCKFFTFEVLVYNQFSDIKNLLEFWIVVSKYEHWLTEF